MLEVAVAPALAAVIAGVVTSFMVPFIARLAFAVRAVDYPGGRRLHGGAVPRLGGVAIAIGLAFGIGSLLLMRWMALKTQVTRGEMLAVLIATAMVFLVGLVDDIVRVSVVSKFLVEIAAATVIVALGWRFSVVGLPSGTEMKLGFMGGVVTVVWIVGVANAINLLDGLDGLAGGVVAIVAGSMLVYALFQGNLLGAIVMGAVCGACVGFLPHNWQPAKIFMGDAGALTLGFLLGAISVNSSLKSSAAVAILIPILALGVPVMDTVLVMLVRFLERPEGRWVDRVLRMFRADRNHVHYLLQRHGASRSTVVRVLYLLVLGSCVMALGVGLTKSSGLGIALVAVEAAVIIVVRTLGLPRLTRALSSRQREEVRRTWAPSEGADGGA